jgi:hypothetical protein
MTLTLSDLVQTGEHVVVLTGEQIREFYEWARERIPPDRRMNRDIMLADIIEATKISGYAEAYWLAHKARPGSPLGKIVGRVWFAEKAKAC